MENKELTLLQKQGAEIVNQAQALEVNDIESYDVAYAFRRAAKVLADQVVLFHKDMKKKAWDAYKEVQANEKKYSEMPKMASDILKGKMEAWKHQEDVRRKEEEAKLKESAKLQGLDEELVSVPEAPKRQGERFRTEWKFEVTDISKVPAEYLMVNERLVGPEVRKLKDKTNIPGIRAYSHKTQVLR